MLEGPWGNAGISCRCSTSTAARSGGTTSCGAPYTASYTRTPSPWFTAEYRARFAETADHMTRSLEELDAARDRAAVTQEELGSRVAEAANQRLYVLSIITAVFLPLGFVCALLGVNVGGVVMQLWLFKRRGWL